MRTGRALPEVEVMATKAAHKGQHGGRRPGEVRERLVAKMVVEEMSGDLVRELMDMLEDG